MSVQLQHVPRGQGSRATHERRERPIRGGNHRGAERRRLRGQAMPQAGAATAPMLCEDGDGDGGAAPEAATAGPVGPGASRPQARNAG